MTPVILMLTRSTEALISSLSTCRKNTGWMEVRKKKIPNKGCKLLSPPFRFYLPGIFDKEVLKPNDREKDSSSTSIENTTF